MKRVALWLKDQRFAGTAGALARLRAKDKDEYPLVVIQKNYAAKPRGGRGRPRSQQEVDTNYAADSLPSHA